MALLAPGEALPPRRARYAKHSLGYLPALFAGGGLGVPTSPRCGYVFCRKLLLSPTQSHPYLRKAAMVPRNSHKARHHKA